METERWEECQGRKENRKGEERPNNEECEEKKQTNETKQNKTKRTHTHDMMCDLVKSKSFALRVIQELGFAILLDSNSEVNAFISGTVNWFNRTTARTSKLYPSNIFTSACARLSSHGHGGSCQGFSRGRRWAAIPVGWRIAVQHFYVFSCVGCVWLTFDMHVEGVNTKDHLRKH